MPWLQLHIPSNAREAEALSQALIEVGAASVTFRDAADEPILEPALGETPLWQQTRVTGLFTADCDTASTLGRLKQNQPGKLDESHWEILEDKDWQRAWMDHYHPIDCGHDLWICPSWLAPPVATATNVLLDPGLAFGTGTHPTTLLCLQWLAMQQLQGARVVDYGCGSGILAIAALLRGAEYATGIDIDPQAVLATRGNGARNSIDPRRLDASLPGGEAELKVDLVFANILAGPLVALAPLLITMLKPGGKLCLSGILNLQADSVMDGYTPYIEFDEPREMDNWVQLAGRRTDTPLPKSNL